MSEICGNPALEADALMPRRRKFDKTKACIKCKVAQGNIVIRHAVYCKACFFPHITFKFRRSLEPFVNPKPQGPRRTALKPAGNLLVGFSGGLGSTILLDLIHRCYVASNDPSNPTDGGRDHPRNEKVWRKITVCYIEISDAFPGMEDRRAEVEDAVRRYDGLDFVSLRIQDAFDPEWWTRTGGRPGFSVLNADLTSEELHVAAADLALPPLQALHSHLASLPTATAVPSTLQTLIRLLLLHTAASTGSSHLVLGTSLTSLAVSLISGVAQGMGFNVREELQEEWTPDEGPGDGTENDRNGDDDARVRSRGSVRVIRPLRDIGMKECAAWAWWTGLKLVVQAKQQSPSSKQAIGALTKDFIMGLEHDYPSTVSTIVRTCGKVAPKGDVIGKCAMCERPVPRGIQDWKSRISIRSRSKPDPDTDAPQEDHLSHPDVSSPDASLTPYLCYACHTTLTSKSSRATPTLYPLQSKPSATVLPIWAGSRLFDDDVFAKKLKMDEKEMKNSVADFLLDD
ncbi:hypothetical protein B0H21DRAFT_759246 [Amylocystis lapponica]|nr:hypothetical protein B0H21DRAFT_759246 [Amylocystis lapponica]